MELRHLRYFIAVAEAGNFTLAAERLHTVQPSLSRQIRDLEAEVGTALFERTSRRVQMTAAGKAFLDEARLVLAQADRAVDRARQAARSGSGRLQVGFVPGVEVMQLSSVVQSLQDEWRDLELTLHSRSSPALIDELQARRLDAAFIRPSPQAAGLSMQIVRRESLIAALPANHRLAKKRRLSASQLEGEPLVDVMQEHAPVLYDAIQTYAAKSGVKLRWAYKADNLMLALSLVRTAGAVSLLPEHARGLFPGGVVGIGLDDDAPTIELALAWHPENTSAALKKFCTTLADWRDPASP